MSEHDVFVIDRDGHSVGAVYVGMRDGDTWLELVEVLPEAQGLGVGSEAVRWVLHRSADAGRGTMLQVHNVNDRARALYTRLGFIPVGQTATHRLLRHA